RVPTARGRRPGARAHARGPRGRRAGPGVDERWRPRRDHRLPARVPDARARGQVRPLPADGRGTRRQRMARQGHPVRGLRVGVGHRPGPRMVRRVTIGASITLAELEDDPYPAFARLRAHEPVAYVPDMDMWLV